MSNGMDPDQVGPDLDQKCLKRLSADYKKSLLARKDFTICMISLLIVITVIFLGRQYKSMFVKDQSIFILSFLTLSGIKTTKMY